ncbi:P-loop containing nucleoside triphosphate hydrolase protein [Zychaea mexicana]|uniref:P-loop containing nucleoside triphosphate hydrolase protein n=1 Tax=Zychaea mexicana TaxID=64656 RepID=UPI0022FE612A|nr:P-loop containing nucleoside triphosphate hydrolase protein [Zychaea mexicana]KAI9490068.1 P-loop containing nucleoside triphosphate hydrolase protein [Zychaea mexicana]
MTKAPTQAAVQVALRIRPLNDRDRAQPRFASLSENDVLNVQDKNVHVVSQGKLFHFDHVFRPSCAQSDIFLNVGDKLVRHFVDGMLCKGGRVLLFFGFGGYNVTILAYGQTSSGKTYTMGTAQYNGGVEHDGIVPRAVDLLFDLLATAGGGGATGSSIGGTSPSARSSPAPSVNYSKSRMRAPRSATPPTTPPASAAGATQHRYSVKVSFVEIYNEELIDLLNPAPPTERPPITIREDVKGQIYWTGVKEMPVQNADDIMMYLQQGTLNRATGATDMNEKSSRSHAILSITLKQERWTPRKQRAQQLGQEDAGDWIITTSKFHFVDLAGSERLKRTAAEGDRRKEGININAGLLALGNVISVLGDPAKRHAHIPYRDSKLTRLLQDSLGGNATTLMIACVSPAEYNLPETINTLQYASRARNIKNKLEKNEVEEWMTTDNVDMLRNMISTLKAELRKGGGGGGGGAGASPQTAPTGTITPLDAGSPVLSGADFDQLYQEQRNVIADLQRQVEELDHEASVTRERNRVVEDELKRVKTYNFQHYAEPIAEEYEKTMSKLESQLAMARAALNHSDFMFEEHQAKIEQYGIVMEDQEKQIEMMERRLQQQQQQQQQQQHASNQNDTHDNSALVEELQSTIDKFKQAEERTEMHIMDLSRKLDAVEESNEKLQIKLDDTLRDREDLQQQYEAKLLSMMVELDKQKSASTSSEDDRSTTTTLAEEKEERRVLHQQIARLQENVLALQAHSEERELASRKRIEKLQEQLEQALEEKESIMLAHEEALKGIKSESEVESLAIVPDLKSFSNHYVQLHDGYSVQLERLDTALDRTHVLLSSKTEMMMASRKNATVMRRVADLDKQLTSQKVKIEDEMIKFEINFDDCFQNKDAQGVMAVLSKAEHDLQGLCSNTVKLEAKLQKTEMALQGNTQQIKNERDMEELRHRMDAIKIHPDDLLDEKRTLLFDRPQSTKSIC